VRIRELFLQRFGPFTDQRLDLSAATAGGLHIIYGQNEAGKSTSLRAVTGLLFGIPARSEDAHLHAAAELRVGAMLERRVGAEVELLEIVRHKRSKNPLTDGQGHPLDEARLAPFLLGVARASFQNRYALDQRELELGARALLSGTEQGLFAAGTAGAGVAQILLRLDEEQAALFRPRGQKYLLNQLLEQLREAEKHLRLSERPAEKWQEQKRALERVSAEVSRYEARRSQLRTELSRKNRLASMLTDVARLIEAQEELDSLGQAPLLPSESTQERVRAVTEEREALQEESVHAGELSLLEERLHALGEPSSLEEVEEERLAAVRNQLGSELKALSDLPKRRAKLEQLTDLVADQLKTLGRPASSAEELSIDPAQEAHLRLLVTEHGQVSADALQAHRSVRRQEEEHRELERRMGELSQESDRRAEVASSTERELLARARERLPPIRRLPEVQQRFELACQEADRLGREFTSVAFVDPPAEEAVKELLDQRQELDRARKGLLAERDEYLAQRDQSLARASTLKEALDLPSEDQLRAARAARDVLLDPQAFLEPAPPALERLRLAIEQADAIADRLRREAVRVSEFVALSMEAHAAGAQVSNLAVRVAELDDQDRAWLLRLATCFSACGTAPQSAPEARAIYARWLRWAEARQVMQHLLAERDRLVAEERALALDLSRLSGRTGDEQVPLEVQLAAVEDALELRRLRSFALEELHKKLHETARLLRQERVAKEVADTRLAAWSRAWQKATRLLGFVEAPNPPEVQTYLSRLSELSIALREQREMQRRVDGMHRDTAIFAELVRQMTRQHAPELAERSPLDAAEELLRRARLARETHAERVRCTREIGRRRQLLGEAIRRRDAARATLASLMQLSGAGTLEEHLELEGRSMRRRELVDVVRALEDTLRGRSGGQLRALIEEVRGLDHDVLQSEIEDLEDALREVDTRHQALVREATSLQQGLEHYGTEDAADARQRAMHRRASAAHTLREVLVLRSARLLLEAEMLEYAREHRSTTLARAEALFSRLTLGKYRALRLGLGQRELRAVRGDQEVAVSELSSGARAQLYLALRLSSLEASLDVPDPLPLVLDDLFVEFDEDRAVAAFEILGELAERTQILYFTHLARDVEAAHDATRGGRVFVHRLGIA
jgi:uncharacterized protein YhaN